MKNMAGKTLIFYHFQLDSNKDYNVTTLPSVPQPPTIKDVLATLPLDLSHGLYHFRFKSQLPDGEDKTIAWIDINNLGAKVPQVNGCIYIKILKLKDASHNKLFHIDKLRKAQIVKINSHPHSLQPPNTKRPNNVTPSHQPNKVNPIPNAGQTNDKNPPSQAVRSPPVPSKISKSPAAQQSAKIIPPAPTVVPTPPKQKSPAAKIVEVTNSNFISFDKHPDSLSEQTKKKLEVFDDQIREEQLNRQNEKIASEELQEIIRKWGYTDGKKINNTPTLMATLHQIWPEWEPVSLTDMLKPEQVAALFKKAAIKLHPDKNRHRHFREKYLSKRVFELLNESRRQ